MNALFLAFSIIVFILTLTVHTITLLLQLLLQAKIRPRRGSISESRRRWTSRTSFRAWIQSVRSWWGWRRAAISLSMGVNYGVGTVPRYDGYLKLRRSSVLSLSSKVASILLYQVFIPNNFDVIFLKSVKHIMYLVKLTNTNELSTF